MTKTAALSAALLAFCAAAHAQEILVRYQPEPDFEPMIRVFAEPMKARDAFAGLAECDIVDAKFKRPVPLARAREMLAPCIAGIGRRYATTLALAPIASAAPGSVSIQIEGLAIYVPETVAVTSPLMKDLQQGLAMRRDRLLQLPVVVRRGEAPLPGGAGKAETPSPRSAAQQAIDDCFITAQVRRIESSEDFIRYYGGCLVNSKPLMVRRIFPVLGRPMNVLLASAADSATVSSLNGPVTVISADGPVTVSILAYPETATASLD